jgi:hypothetical protein
VQRCTQDSAEGGGVGASRRLARGRATGC